jgi:hypothetical protein
MSERNRIIKKVLKSLNGSIEVLSRLERDVPITSVASMEMNNVFAESGLEEVGRESLRVAKRLNEYKKKYWKLEMLIRQHFIDILKKRGYLPGRSLEVESLAGALPEALIKGDERIWIYSYDHYLPKIAESVGRDSSGAPGGSEIWTALEKRFQKRIDNLVDDANSALPEVFYLKSRLATLIRNKDLELKNVRVRKPRVTRVERPVKKVMIVKRPIPLAGKVKKPRKRVLKKPSFEVIGPEEGK